MPNQNTLLDLSTPQSGSQGDQSTPSPLSGPSGPDDPHASMLDAMHRQAAAKWKSVKQMLGLADATRRELESLLDKGPGVSSEDVLEGMAKLVARGGDPQAFTTMIAGDGTTPPMPQSGEALNQWLMMQEAQLVQKESALKQASVQIGLEAGSAALHVLANQHVRGKAAEGRRQTGSNFTGLAPQAPSNPLTAGGPSPSGGPSNA